MKKSDRETGRTPNRTKSYEVYFFLLATEILFTQTNKQVSCAQNPIFSMFDAAGGLAGNRRVASSLHFRIRYNQKYQNNRTGKDSETT